jgi:hypothetical protein
MLHASTANLRNTAAGQEHPTNSIPNDSINTAGSASE